MGIAYRSDGSAGAIARLRSATASLPVTDPPEPAPLLGESPAIPALPAPRCKQSARGCTAAAASCPEVGCRAPAAGRSPRTQLRPVPEATANGYPKVLAEG